MRRPRSATSKPRCNRNSDVAKKLVGKNKWTRKLVKINATPTKTGAPLYLTFSSLSSNRVGQDKQDSQRIKQINMNIICSTRLVC